MLECNPFLFAHIFNYRYFTTFNQLCKTIFLYFLPGSIERTTLKNPFLVLSVYNIKYARMRAWVNCATRQVLSFRKLQDSTQPRRASHSRTHKTELILALSCTTFYTIFLVQPFQESCKLCHKTATNFRRYSWNAALTGFNPYLQHAFCTSIIFCRYKILY